MEDIVDLMRSFSDYSSAKGSTKDSVSFAEYRLGLNFAKEYKQYIMACGFASLSGHEFTGICKSKRLNVVDVTEYQKKMNSAIPRSWYVVEQANIDGIVIWQNEAGEIFQTMPNRKPKKIAGSLSEYIMLFQ